MGFLGWVPRGGITKEKAKRKKRKSKIKNQKPLCRACLQCSMRPQTSLSKVVSRNVVAPGGGACASCDCDPDWISMLSLPDNDNQSCQSTGRVSNEMCILSPNLVTSVVTARQRPNSPKTVCVTQDCGSGFRFSAALVSILYNMRLAWASLSECVVPGHVRRMCLCAQKLVVANVQRSILSDAVRDSLFVDRLTQTSLPLSDMAERRTGSEERRRDKKKKKKD